MLRFTLFFSIVLVSHGQIMGKMISYQPDNEDFPNPERGFYVQGMYRQIQRPVSHELTAEALNKFNQDYNITLLRYYFRIDDWKDKPLSQGALDEVQAIFDIVRDAGFKIIPRFAYNFGGIDASREQILSHMEQLAPVLIKNSDIIAFMEAGFIGQYGEWHHYGSEDVYNLDNAESRRAVLFKLLDVLPKDRMVALRYAHWKRQIYETNEPLAISEAFSGSNRSRTGAHNDCVGANIHNGGTYVDENSNDALQWQKDYLNKDNRYVPQGGETCGTSEYSTCSPMLEDFERMRWDVINVGYQSNVIQSWRDGGCYEEISKNLGYRISLISASLADSVRPGGLFTGSLKITNTGWGKIYNPRHVHLVFRPVSSGQEFRVPIHRFQDTLADPRYWLKGDTATVSFQARIPDAAEEGSWRVYLNFPDTAASLSLLADYSIRLANKGLWDSATGFNDLQHTVTLSHQAPSSVFKQAQSGASVVFKGVRKSGDVIDVKFDLPAGGAYKMTVFDVSGAQVWGKETRIITAGTHVFKWISDNLKTGIYILSLEGPSHDNKYRFAISFFVPG